MKRGDTVLVLQGIYAGKKGQLKQGLQTKRGLIWEIIFLNYSNFSSSCRTSPAQGNAYPETIWVNQNNISVTATGGEEQNT